MSNLIQTLAFILPVIATLCVLSVISVNIYLKIRRKFPINVNCWFCNEWTKVHYDNYNSFYCPKCSQYNGFNEEGGYNKVLSEQHDELLNQQVPLIQKNNGFKLTNGLCHICNNNQKLKIYQLANFVPLNDDMFDVEVEHFEKQLEKAYKLCPRCDGVVKKVISRQNRWLLGAKINTLKTKGLSLLDLNKSSSSLSKKSKQSIFLRFLNLMLILFASLIFLFTVCNIDFMSQNFKHTINYIISFDYPMFTIFNNSRIAFANGFHKYLNISIPYLSAHVANPSAFLGNLLDSNISSTFGNLTSNIDTALLKSLLNLPRPDVHMLCVTGLFFQTTSLFFSERITYQNVKLFILWGCLLAMTKNEYVVLDPAVTLSLQIVISSYIVYAFFKDVRKNETNRSNIIYKRKRTSNILAENKSSYQAYLADNEDDFINDHSSTTDPFSLFNSTLKPKTTYNETDTANSDCSYGSFISRYTHNPFKEPLPRVRSPLAANQRDHAFGKPPNFVYSLTAAASSPGLFTKANSDFDESFSTRSHRTSFRELNSRMSKCEPRKINNQSNSFDLNESLHNLHLDRNCYDVRAPKIVPITVLKNNNAPRPIISPPKLTCTSRNSWLPTDDGFWNNVKDVHYERANISSSSSQSSGFASQTTEMPDMKVYSNVFRRQSSFSDSGSRLFKQNYHVYRNQNGWSKTLGHIFKPIQPNKMYNDDLIS